MKYVFHSEISIKKLFRVNCYIVPLKYIIVVPTLAMTQLLYVFYIFYFFYDLYIISRKVEKVISIPVVSPLILPWRETGCVTKNSEPLFSTSNTSLHF